MTTDRMTRPEAVTLCRLAKAACPQQAFDEYTPDAWFELLRDLRFEDCKDALFAVVKESLFCAPAEIRAHIKRVRTDRLLKFGHISPTHEMFGGDWRQESAWICDVQRRVADGELTREEHDAEMRALGYMGDRKTPELEGVFRGVDETAADGIAAVREAFTTTTATLCGHGVDRERVKCGDCDLAATKAETEARESEETT